MKTMSCNQLAGACDMKFSANTFDEIGEMSRQHAMQMASKGDDAHIQKMDEMKQMMKNPESMQAWFDQKRQEFESLPEDTTNN